MKYGYYASSPNAVMRSDMVYTSNGTGGLVGLVMFCCIIGFMCYCMCKGKCSKDDEGSSSGESVEEVVEETVVEERVEESFG